MGARPRLSGTWGVGRGERKRVYNCRWGVGSGRGVGCGQPAQAEFLGCDWNTAWIFLGEVCACSQRSIVPATRRAFYVGSLGNQTCPGPSLLVRVPCRLVGDACVALSTREQVA